MGQTIVPVIFIFEYFSPAIVPILGINLGILELFLQHLGTLHYIPLRLGLFAGSRSVRSLQLTVEEID